MLDDILQFAAQTLVDDGRLSFWMPTANDQDQEMSVPTHPYLEIVSVCTQVFNKCMLRHAVAGDKKLTRTGSRRLITYRRLPDAKVDQEAVKAWEGGTPKLEGKTADELNPFRKAYFNGFESPGTVTPGAE